MVPSLIVTGDIAKEQLQLIKEQGFNLLHKPVPPARLRSFLVNSINKPTEAQHADVKPMKHVTHQA